MRRTATPITRVREQVLTTVRTHALIAPGARVIVGVSGGADSLCLLHVLASLQPTLGCTVIAAAFDHGLRGAASAADTAFVAATAAAWDIPVQTGQPTAPLAGDEASARTARYTFLQQTALQVDASTIAVGHHADDQAETVLLRLLRGTGTDGLAGMRWQSPAPVPPHLPLIRPLLAVRRAAIEAYCAALPITPRHDASNDDPVYLRNRVRAELLPALHTYNPAIVDLLAQTAAIAAADSDFLDTALNAATAADETRTPTAIALPRSTFRALPPALARRWVSRAGMALLSPGHGLTYDRVLAAAALGQHGRTGQTALLGGGLSLRVTARQITVTTAAS